MNQAQPEVCVTHRIRLQPGEASSKLTCPVCAQMSNQESLRRRSRRR